MNHGVHTRPKNKKYDMKNNRKTPLSPNGKLKQWKDKSTFELNTHNRNCPIINDSPKFWQQKIQKRTLKNKKTKLLKTMKKNHNNLYAATTKKQQSYRKEKQWNNKGQATGWTQKTLI